MSLKLEDVFSPYDEDDVAVEKVKAFIFRNPTKLNETFEYYWEWEWEYKGKGTLLHFSCLYNKPKVVSYLLSKNADVTMFFKSSYGSWNGLTAKQLAEKRGCEDIVNLFEQYEREQAKREQAERLVVKEQSKPVSVLQTSLSHQQNPSPSLQPTLTSQLVQVKPVSVLQPSLSHQQIPSPSFQPSSTSQPALNLRCFENLESNSRVPLAPFILLDSSEIPVPFEDAILCAYEGISISDHLDSFMGHCEGEIFEELVQNGTTITLPECLAVYFYTLEWPKKELNTYSRLNKCLISENREGARPWRYFLHYLFGALRKIPKWDGRQDLYRGVSRNLVEDFPGKYIVGKKITWYSCTSTTTNLPKIMTFLPPNQPRTIFTINGVISGRSIQNFSAVPDEAEILIPPGSRFEIMGVVQLDPNTTMIQLKQVASLEKQLKLE